MGLLPQCNLSEDVAISICVIPLLVICLYSLGVIITRIEKWVIRLHKNDKVAQSI